MIEFIEIMRCIAAMTGYLLHMISNKIMGRIMRRGQG